MPKVIVKAGTVYDGEYDLDLTHFSWRERAYIAEHSGTLPPQFVDRWFGSDPKTVLATVGVMMQRAGTNPDLDALLDTDEGSITIDYTDLQNKAGDESPPDHTPSSSDGLGENNESTRRSGDASTPLSDGPATPPSGSGSPGSAASAA